MGCHPRLLRRAASWPRELSAPQQPSALTICAQRRAQQTGAKTGALVACGHWRACRENPTSPRAIFRPPQNQAPPSGSTLPVAARGACSGASCAERRARRRLLARQRAALPCRAICAHGTYQGRVHSDLRAAPQRQAICHDLNAPTVSDWEPEVHVSQEHVGFCSPRSGFSAHRGGRALQSSASRSQNSRLRAG